MRSRCLENEIFMTSPAVVTPTRLNQPLWLAAHSEANASAHIRGSNDPSERFPDRTEMQGSTVMDDFAHALWKGRDNSPNIQLAPFRDRLTLRRQRYVPLGDRSPLESLAPLVAGNQLAPVAMGQWPSSQATKETTSTENDPEHWILAKLIALEPSTKEVEPPTPSPAAIHLVPYLYMGMTPAGDLSLRLLPAYRHKDAELALSTLDGVGREFKISAQASFIQRIAQLQKMQLELGQELAIRRSLYNTLAQAPLRPSQALRYFDRLLDESPYPPSRTPASDRLIQRRQLFKPFSTSSQSSLWDAYAAVAQWVNQTAPGDAAQRWHSCCHGPGATMLRQALAYAVALQYDQQDNAESLQQPRISGAQRSLAASDALQNRIQQLRNDKAIARQTTSKLTR